MIPEFVGRLPIIIHLDELTEEMMVEILTQPKNSLIKQYKHMFQIENVDLFFSDGVLSKVAEQAIKEKSGARGLRAIIENLLEETMYDAPDEAYLREVLFFDNDTNMRVYDHSRPPYGDLDLTENIESE